MGEFQKPGDLAVEQVEITCQILGLCQGDPAGEVNRSVFHFGPGRIHNRAVTAGR